MRTNRDNLLSIDIARAFAALSVFVYHYGAGAVLAKYTGISAFNWLAIPGANYGVTLFFVISGFCIHRSEWRRLAQNASGSFDTWGYFARRFRRIYPVYAFALLLSCLVNGLNSDWPGFGDVGAHVLLLHGFSAIYFNGINVVLWTISVEAFFYIIYPAWLNYRLKAGLSRAFVAGTALSALSCFVSARLLYPYGFPTRWFFLSTWGGWLLGALLAETIDQHAAFYKSWRWWLPGLVAWTSALWVEARGLYAGRLLILLFPVRIYLSAWLFSAIVLLENRFADCGKVLRKPVHVVSLIGLSSYSLYLLHEPLISVRNLLQGAIHFAFMKLAFQVVWFFVVIGFSWLSYRHLELRFIKRRPVSAAPAMTATQSPAIATQS